VHVRTSGFGEYDKNIHGTLDQLNGEFIKSTAGRRCKAPLNIDCLTLHVAQIPQPVDETCDLWRGLVFRN